MSHFDEQIMKILSLNCVIHILTGDNIGTMKKICQICNQEFDCLGNESCWCFKIKISKDQLEKLSSCSDYCVCKNCLKNQTIKNHDTLHKSL